MKNCLLLLFTILFFSLVASGKVVCNKVSFYSVPPKAYSSSTDFDESTVFFKENVFGYHYESRDRLSEKNVPGGGWTKFVYDKSGRKVLEQSENQRLTNSWSFVKYDALGREIVRGQVVNGSSRQVLQDGFDNMAVGYEVSASSNQSFPFTVTEADASWVGYFDGYSWLPANMTFDAANAFHSQQTNVIGLPTGGKVRNPIDNSWLFSVSYYDNKKRVIQSFKDDGKGQIKRIETQYSFAGEVLNQRINYKDIAGNPIVKQTNSSYDHVGRKMTFSLGINNPAEPISQYDYDNVGRLKTKKIYPNRTYQQLGSTPEYIIRPPNPTTLNRNGEPTQDIATKAVCLLPGTLIVPSVNNTYIAQIGVGGGTATVQGLQTIDYDYHIRGMVNCVNCSNGVATGNVNQNDFFANKLEFETAGYYDGNIGKQSWQSTTNNSPSGGQTGLVRGYTYNYDATSRLKSANYIGESNENFSLNNISYDQNGNILSLLRKGKNSSNFTDIDNLSYVYSGNRLQSVSDAVVGNEDIGDFRDSNTSGNDYEYWPDGSLKKDLNKGISLIDYDSYLRKVKRVEFSNGTWENWYYDGVGTLLKRQLSDGTVWQYDDDAIYKNGQLYQIGFEGGRIVPKIGGGYVYEFEYRDHQNNLRVAYKEADGLAVNGIYPAPIISQATDYDAWGWQLPIGQTGGQNFTYSNREWQKETGWYQLGLRMYDPLRGRFDQIDPSPDIEGQESLSTYQYGWNNPVLRNDPNGDCPGCKPKLSATTSLAIHSTLDVVGLVPGFGEVADGINALMYLAEGNKTDAAISGAAMIPIAGMIATGAKAIKNIDKAVDIVKVGEKVVEAAKSTEKGGVYVLKDADNVVKRTGRTKDLAKRKAQHEAAQDTKSLEFKTVEKTDNYSEQRGLEDIIYNKYQSTASSANGGLNKIKAISDKNTNKNEYLNAANEYLKRKGGSQND